MSVIRNSRVDSRAHKVRADRVETVTGWGKDGSSASLETIKGEVLLMQTVTIQRRIEQLPALSRTGKRINGLHRLMRSSYLYERAYVRVSRNKGALTPGVDGQTFDGMSLEKLGSPRPACCRRPLPPSSGSTGLHPEGQRQVAAAWHPDGGRPSRPGGGANILAAIYEPVFSQHSHGFRSGRSCHTALEEIRDTWTGAKWLIEVDVRGFFDNIDHDILLKLIARAHRRH